MSSATAVTFLLLLGTIVCDVCGQVCFKLGVGHETGGPRAQSLLQKVLHSRRVGLGVAVYVVEFALWFSALSRVQLSFAFPIMALSYAGVVLASRWLLHEHVSLRRWVGVGTIVIGVALVAAPQLG